MPAYTFIESYYLVLLLYPDGPHFLLTPDSFRLEFPEAEVGVEEICPLPLMPVCM